MKCKGEVFPPLLYGISTEVHFNLFIICSHACHEVSCTSIKRLWKKKVDIGRAPCLLKVFFQILSGI